MAVVVTHSPEAEHIFDYLKPYKAEWSSVNAVAVALSGGPDSMALLWLLAHQRVHNLKIHALIVDHGLREGSADEAENVRNVVSGWDNVEVHILRWEGGKPEAAIQEAARHARYDLMADYCRAHGIHHLFLAHHRDDQAETVLFRLAKGSGLDGLSGMRAVQPYNTLTLLRPLLEFSKDALIALCDEHDLQYVRDPSNQNADFARVRLRRSADILSEEGLSAKRLAATAKRINRAREALDFYAEKAQKDCVLLKNTKRIEYNYKKLQKYPDEVVFRCVLAAFQHFNPDADYAPRMEKVETLLYDLISSEDFRKRTLGGLVFDRDDKNGQLIIEQENT